jgi:hypothetical protein
VRAPGQIDVNLDSLLGTASRTAPNDPKVS